MGPVMKPLLANCLVRDMSTEEVLRRAPTDMSQQRVLEAHVVEHQEHAAWRKDVDKGGEESLLLVRIEMV